MNRNNSKTKKRLQITVIFFLVTLAIIAFINLEALKKFVYGSAGCPLDNTTVTNNDFNGTAPSFNETMAINNTVKSINSTLTTLIKYIFNTSESELTNSTIIPLTTSTQIPLTTSTQIPLTTSTQIPIHNPFENDPYHILYEKRSFISNHTEIDDDYD